MDCEYLKKNVGSVLADGLASVILHGPEDPVHCLSQYLLQYVANQQAALKRAEHERLLAVQEVVRVGCISTMSG